LFIDFTLSEFKGRSCVYIKTMTILVIVMMGSRIFYLFQFQIYQWFIIKFHDDVCMVIGIVGNPLVS